MSAIYLDSWWEPNAAAIAWAVQQGYAGWLGYFKETANDRIYHGWSDATFLAVKAAGLHTADYDSGLDDPAWVRDRNARLGIVGILDVEGSIEGDGPWVDPWMATAGPAERQYGGGTVINNHRTHGHPGYIVAGYPSNSGTINPSDPGLTWAGLATLPSPARPIGRQYAGSVPTPFGSVDYSHFDPAFFGTPTPGPTPPTPIPEGDEPVLIYMPIHKQLRSFAVSGGRLCQNWPDQTGALHGAEAVDSAPINSLPAQLPSVVEEPNGTISVEVHDVAGNRFHVYQLLASNTWNVAGLLN